MSRRGWKAAIEKALRKKGFSKTGAKKTAIMTVQRSIECRQRKGPQSVEPEPIPIVKAAPTGAIYKPSSMAGRIVVIPPKERAAS